jgi:O-succinylhomoserine sulfhydrylase
LSVGDHLVAAKAAFGSCRWLVDNLLPRFGIETTVVDGRDLKAWEEAIRPNTKVFFFETPANPTMDIVDLRGLCDMAKAHGITTVVDNAFCTSVIQKPMDFGADIVAYSATKLMEGQGRVLAGAVCGSEAFINDVLMPFQRNTGPNLSPFNAWVVHKGLETLELRARRQSENSLAVGRAIEHRVSRILHPGLESHPQFELAQSQMAMCGPIFSFILDGGRDQAMAFLNALELVDISNNIGDARSLCCHPASTTHFSVSAEARADMGVVEGMLRINIGLEDPIDLIADMEQALTQVGL